MPVVTITFSPCIDKCTSVPALLPDKKLQCSMPQLSAGGGGINVARAITRLGGKAEAIFPAGGYHGALLQQMMQAEEVPSTVIAAASDTRENIMVWDELNKQQYRLGMPGSVLTEKECQACLAAVTAQAVGGFLVASGSLPPGVPPDVFAQLAAIARRKEARLVVDTKGEALLHAVKEGVYMIKPNLGELCALAGVERSQGSDAMDLARQVLNHSRCSIIVVSLGAEGALLVSRTEAYQVPAPALKVSSTVGAGDSMVAGIVYSLQQGQSLQSALQYGVACGSAATLHPGAMLCTRADADRLYASIRQQKTPPNSAPISVS
ncbi:MAG TPA: 1-phosphofructokinase family hexose kinase [Chitinophagaceae bacterium]|nr:1-phosphofructokinase family hexose kinase [Chitinophagaceae bacterium]